MTRLCIRGGPTSGGLVCLVRPALPPSSRGAVVALPCPGNTWLPRADPPHTPYPGISCTAPSRHLTTAWTDKKGTLPSALQGLVHITRNRLNNRALDCRNYLLWETRNMLWLRLGGDSHWAGLGSGPWILSSHSLKPANTSPTRQQPSSLILPQSIFLGPPTVASMAPSCLVIQG